MLHVCVTDVFVGHAVPLFAAGVVIVIMLDWVPPPQVAVHVDHADHALVAQFTVNNSSIHLIISSRSPGQACVLHVCEPVSDPHAVPPFAAGVVTVRVQDCVPPPQVAEHVVHADHALSTQFTDDKNSQNCEFTQLPGHPFVLHA
jgi:hypothetical protein